MTVPDPSKYVSELEIEHRHHSDGPWGIRAIRRPEAAVVVFPKYVGYDFDYIRLFPQEGPEYGI